MIDYNLPTAIAVRSESRTTILHRTLARMNVADILTLSYLSYTSILIAICRRNIDHWQTLVLIHTLLMLLVMGLARGRDRRRPLLDFLGQWYPTVLFIFFFEEIGFTVHAIHPGWFDWFLIGADHAMFGVHPTIWIEQFNNYWLNELMQLSYTSYFLMTIGVGAYFWSRGDRRNFEILIAATSAAYYICYTLFVYIPIESPYHTLREFQRADLTGGPVTSFIGLIEKYGRVHGGAFPSAHVAGSMVALIVAYLYARRLGYWLTPVVVSICISTVYGRYHYVMDVFGGMLVAVAGVWVGIKLCAWREREQGAMRRIKTGSVLSRQ